MSFIKAYLHKEYLSKKRWQHLVCRHRLGYSPWNATIPGELLSSRARFLLMANASKLDPNPYIYNLSEKWGGHSAARIPSLQARLRQKPTGIFFPFRIKAVNPAGISLDLASPGLSKSPYHG